VMSTTPRVDGTTPFRWNLEDCFYDLAFANAEFV
jgi:hypothetical protein